MTEAISLSEQATAIRQSARNYFDKAVLELDSESKESVKRAIEELKALFERLPQTNSAMEIR